MATIRGRVFVMGQQRRNTSIYAAVRKRCLFGSWGFLSAGLKLSGQAAANYALSWAGLDNLAYTFRTEEYAPAFVYQTCSSRVEDLALNVETPATNGGGSSFLIIA